MIPTLLDSKDSPSISTSQTDVVIIGAGPAGLMAAQALANLGIGVVVVERRAPNEVYGNADGLQPRTLEIWQSYGMLDRFSQRASAMHALVTYDKQKGGGIKRGIPSWNIVVDCRYPYELTASIRIIESTLRSEFERKGGLVTQPAQPLEIITDNENGVSGGGVTVKVQHLSRKDSQETLESRHPMTAEIEYIRAKYVIGADGAHSWVRRHLGIQLQGEKTEHVWGAIDVWADTDFPDSRFKCIIQSPQGAIIIIPREEEKLRIYVQCSSDDKPIRGSPSIDEIAAIKEKLLRRITESLQPYSIKFTRVFWSTIFSVPQKVASAFRVGSTFIIGDACHTHSPKAGQGANVSMGDAHNLAWKMAWVLRGWSSESLLDTYEVERRALALELIEFDKAISASLDGCEASVYHSMLHQQNLFSSGVGIQYNSKLTVGSSSRVEERPTISALLSVGMRLPPGRILRFGDWNLMDMQDLAPSDGLFKILIFCGDVLDENRFKALKKFTGVFESLDRGKNSLSERFTMHAIVHNSKETNIRDRVSPSLRNWKR
ncbi:FAD binding domain-containing protein [Collybia nuda]|uniref:FAD binding domain-containing protein n=1 Tax=Collybia nuda TaxID=64659 RepID=A0A9P5Y910_9AGAR|nr:FAD binding domain-containing protein [Collybia nuda]